MKHKSAECCPTCKRPYYQPFGKRTSGRICVKCKKPLGRFDKWRFVDGKIEHRYCNNPESYRPKND